MSKKKIKYYRLDKILKENAHYNIIFGERSNGKTYACLEYSISNYITKGEQLALIRRNKEDFRGKRGQQMFDSLVSNNVITKLSKGEWNNIYYWSGRWYLRLIDETGEEIRRDSKPCAFAFALTDMEHDKSTSYPDVTTIVLDEFLTRGYYLPDEFIIFCNVLSTIIRLRNNVKIFMLGNTVNKHCPYFKEMGLNNIKNMKQNEIDIYKYGESNLKVAVEFADTVGKKKDSNVYFAFDNPKLNMIKGSGNIWEMDIYPHIPYKYSLEDVKLRFYIEFDEDILQGNVIVIEHESELIKFIYIHRKTTDIKFRENEIVYSTEISVNKRHNRFINRPLNRPQEVISSFFKSEKVFYQDNEVGEIVNNYIKWCK